MPRDLADVRVSGRRPALATATVRRVVHSVLRAERRDADVSITFLGAITMRRLNDEFLGHDQPTDVISFGLAGPDGRLAGDVYLCRAVAARNARRHGVPLRQELVRLVIHGTLHVLGYDHPDGDRRTRSPMWQRQERYVKRFG
jgi:probable rRNA maturation factor